MTRVPASVRHCHPVMYTRRIRHTVLTNTKHARTHHGRAFLPQEIGMTRVPRRRHPVMYTRRIRHTVLTSMKHARTRHGRALLPRNIGMTRVPALLVLYYMFVQRL